MHNEHFAARELGSLDGLDFDRFVRGARTARLGISLAIIGGVHLLIFGFCEFLFARGDRAATHFLPLWGLDVAFALALLRPRLLTMFNLDSARAARLALRVWLTFVILCLTSASLNSLTGFEVDWFKISWAMLGTFAFAMLGWVFHLGFLVPAVLMSLTALLIAAHPEHAYAIFGLSWFFLLQGLSLLLEARRLTERWFRGSWRSESIIIQHRSPEV